MPQYQLVNDAPAVMIHDMVVRDRRISAHDLGIYVRLCHAATMWENPYLELLIREFGMPREETEAALQRLVALEILDELPEEAR